MMSVMQEITDNFYDNSMELLAWAADTVDEFFNTFLSTILIHDHPCRSSRAAIVVQLYYDVYGGSTHYTYPPGTLES